MKEFFEKTFSAVKMFCQKVFNAVKKFLTDNKDELVKPTVVLLAICIVIPLALAITNAVTVKRIEELEKKASMETMSKLVKADKFEEKENLNQNFVYNEAVKDGEIIAYIFKASAKGYGGDITVMTALSPDGKVLDVAILDVSNETPGLGQNVTKKDFYSQFIGKKDRISFKDIDTVTGATFSSKAVTTAINEAMENFKHIIISAEDDIKTESDSNGTEVETNETK